MKSSMMSECKVVCTMGSRAPYHFCHTLSTIFPGNAYDKANHNISSAPTCPAGRGPLSTTSHLQGRGKSCS
eukprot:g47825.t1